MNIVDRKSGHHMCALEYESDRKLFQVYANILHNHIPISLTLSPKTPVTIRFLRPVGTNTLSDDFLRCQKLADVIGLQLDIQM